MPDYSKGPQFDFDPGQMPTPPGSGLPNDPYANMQILKQSSPFYKRLMKETYERFAPGYVQDIVSGKGQQQQSRGRGIGRSLIGLAIPGFAQGGFHRYGDPAVVGEEGPELLMPGGAGDMVVPLGMTARSAAPPMELPPPVNERPARMSFEPPPSASQLPPPVAATTQQSPPPMAELPPPPGQPRTTPAMQQALDVFSQAPPKPKVYERVLDAVSRTRIGRPAAAFNPYPQRFEQWEANRANAQAGLQMERAALELERQNRQADASIAASNAAQGASNARTQLYNKQAGQVGVAPPANSLEALLARLISDPNSTQEQIKAVQDKIKETRSTGRVVPLAEQQALNAEEAYKATVLKKPSEYQLAPQEKVAAQAWYKDQVNKDSQGADAAAVRQLAFAAYAQQHNLDPAKLDPIQQRQAIRDWNEGVRPAPQPSASGEPLYPVSKNGQIVYVPRSQAAGMVVPRAMPSEQLVQVFKDGQVTYVPRSQAAGGAAPRTIYDAAGVPSVGGQQGVSLAAPPGISDATQNQIAGFNTALSNAQDIERMLNDPKFANVGPLIGRLKLFEIDSNRLGGLGATVEEIKLATSLQRLLSTQAFAEGGKQLTPTELEQFQRVSPSMQDTVASAIQKTKDTIAYLKKKRQDRFDAMPIRQRNQFGPAATGTGGSSGGGPVEVTLPNGNKIKFPSQAAADAFRKAAGIP